MLFVCVLGSGPAKGFELLKTGLKQSAGPLEDPYLTPPLLTYFLTHPTGITFSFNCSPGKLRTLSPFLGGKPQTGGETSGHQFSAPHTLHAQTSNPLQEAKTCQPSDCTLANLAGSAVSLPTRSSQQIAGPHLPPPLLPRTAPFAPDTHATTARATQPTCPVSSPTSRSEWGRRQGASARPGSYLRPCVLQWILRATFKKHCVLQGFARVENHKVL